MRVFVLGNGPSLAHVNLDNLTGIACATNRIHLLFPTTNWRPTYWIMADHNTKDEWPLDEILAEDCKFLVRSDFASAFEPHRTRDNVEYFQRCDAHDHMNVEQTGIPEEWHLPTYCRFGGGLFIAMQKAVLLGAKQIVLLGCDLYGPRGEEDTNHFDPAYCQRICTPEEYDRFNRTLIRAHENAKRSCEKLGVEVLNASGGSLEVYPRVSLESVL
ncbi:MAG: hypothetical protein WC935_00255 [Thermoleophilia bacterium]